MLPEIEEHLRAVAADEQPFDIQLRGTGTFRPVSPVVFVQLAAGIGECERLEQRVRSGPLARELPLPVPPARHRRPRRRRRRARPGLRRAGRLRGASSPVWGFSLYEHVEGVWRPQRDFPLGRELPGPVPADFGQA